MTDACVVAVSASAGHTFSKPNREAIVLVEGLGVEGDVHASAMVKDAHGALIPNHRQVHLIHAELFDALAAEGFALAPGDIGENITTRGVDLMNAPEHTRVHIGEKAVVELRGLRAPCAQLDKFAPGLKRAMLAKDGSGKVRVKSGVMGIVVVGGVVRPGDAIRLSFPAGESFPLEPI